MAREARPQGLPYKGGSAQATVSSYERIKAAIISGELPPSQPLAELTLAEWCQVSRTPVREALGRLEQDRLIERGPRGWIVREKSPGEILDIYETRIALEAMVGRLAAERRTEHDLIAMRRAAAVMSAQEQPEPGHKAKLNSQFHRVVWHSTHNTTLIDLLERINMHLGRYPETTLSYPGRWEMSNVEHDQLVDAIADRDHVKAEQIATHHFTEARDIRLRLWAEAALDDEG